MNLNLLKEKFCHAKDQTKYNDGRNLLLGDCPICEGNHSRSNCFLNLYSKPVIFRLTEQEIYEAKKLQSIKNKKKFKRRAKKTGNALLIDFKSHIKDLRTLDKIFDRSIKKNKAIKTSSENCDKIENSGNLLTLPMRPYFSNNESDGKIIDSQKIEELNPICLPIPLNIKTDFDRVYLFRYYYPQFNFSSHSFN